MKRRYFSKFFSNLETILAVRRFVTWLQGCGRSTIGLKLELGRIAYMNSQFNFSFSVLNNTSCQSPVIEKGLRRIGVFLFVTFLKWVKVFHTFFSLCLILPSVCTRCFFFVMKKNHASPTRTESSFPSEVFLNFDFYCCLSTDEL